MRLSERTLTPYQGTPSKLSLGGFFMAGQGRRYG
jgi:hypothetical protein